MIGYQHQSGWTLASGLEYNRVVEFLEIDDTLSFESVDILNEKAFYFINQNLDTLFFGDSITLVNSEIRTVRHNNSHRYFNVPFMVGYRHHIGNANLFGSFGISYAFIHGFKGREAILLGEKEIEIEDDPSFEFSNRLGLRLGIGIEYPLSQNSFIFTKMDYQRSPNLSKAGLEQYYHSYSIGAGIRIRLDSFYLADK